MLKKNKFAHTMIMMVLILAMVIATGVPAMAATPEDQPITIQPIGDEISLSHELAVSAVWSGIYNHGRVEEWELENILNWCSTANPIYFYTSPDGQTVYRYYELIRSVSNILIRTDKSGTEDVIIYGFAGVSDDGQWLTDGYVYKLEIPTVSIQPIEEPDFHIW